MSLIKTIRCWVDITNPAAFTDINGASLQAWASAGLQVQVAFGIGPQSVRQLASVSTSAFYMKLWLVGSPDSTFFSAVQTGGLTTLTFDQWTTGNATNDPAYCHAYWTIPGASLALSVPGGGGLDYRITVYDPTDPTDPDVCGLSTVTFKDAGLATTGPVQASNIIPLAAVYDGSGHYTLTTIAGTAYVWTQGAHDTSVTNVTAGDVTTGALWVANGSSVILNGTPGAAVTAAVWYPVVLTVAGFNALFLAAIGSSGGNKIYTGTANPNSAQTGSTGDEYKQIAGSPPHLVRVWTKVSGAGTTTVWE